MIYTELHCHSYYSFHDGASSLEELLIQAKALGYHALALTDHDNLCAAMRFAQLARSLNIQGIIGAELTLNGGAHITLLAKDQVGYRNLCRLITAAHKSGERDKPELSRSLLAEHAPGLIALSGCPRGDLPQMVIGGQHPGARELVKQYLEWFGKENYYIELQQNMVFGDTERNKKLHTIANEMGVGMVATSNVHYHIRERHQLQDCLVAIRNCKSLEETHQERRPNSEFYLRSKSELETIFHDCPEALANTAQIAERCTMDLPKDLSYTFPDYPAPPGFTVEGYLEKLCNEAAIRRYGTLTSEVQERLKEELRLIRKYNLAGFLLMYHEVIKLGREVMIEQGLSDPSLTVEENPPGRGRGSSVALLVGYLIGLSHIDPLKYKLSLERFLPDDTMTNVPDIDLDFPRSIREDLILRTHEKWGWERAVLTGTIATYQVKGAVRDLGKALGLPQAEVDRLAKYTDHGSAKSLESQMSKSPHSKDKIDAPVWRDLIRLSSELDGFPKYTGQHPGGMILSSSPLTEIVPVQRGAIEGRYVCQWDKDSIDDAGFVKIDFLALGALSQLQEAIELIKQRTGERIDMSRIDFEDNAVYDMLCKGDTIGIFQVESAAQMQTITRLKPRNLLDMAHEVGAVRPGVGVNHGVHEYLARRTGQKPLTYDHPLEKRALERTLGVVLFQDQVNQLAIDVAGFAPSDADRLRRAFGRKHNKELIEQYRKKFLEGAKVKGVSEAAADTIFKKFNGLYMFPESHAFAFGVTAYQASWLKFYYPLEFFVAIFNQQPMGFYSLETLKEDARRHGITILNPDINRSQAKCTIEAAQEKPALTVNDRPTQTISPALRLGFLNVLGLGEIAAKAIEDGRAKDGPFQNIGDFLERTGVLEEVALNLASAGAFDRLEPNRRKVKWEIGLRYRPINSQLSLPLPVEQDVVDLDTPSNWERMNNEYNVLNLFPAGHIMATLRPRFNSKVRSSKDIGRLPDGAELMTAGLVIRRQRPLGKAVFITLEDEFGHVPCMVFPKVYERYEHKFKSPFLIINGRVSRREGTYNVVINQVRAFNALDKAPQAKDWR
jgi:error-prone DNA polymerase